MRHDTQAAASTVVAFLLAGVVFIGAVGALLVTGRETADRSATGQVSAETLGLQATALADLLVNSPGYHVINGGTPQEANVADWSTLTADQVKRLGLREGDGRFMDFEKFQNLRRAGYAHQVDGFVNYPDARTSLGLDELDLDFHLRAFPSLKSVREILADGKTDPNLRVAYIGDVNSVSSGNGPSGLVSADISAPTCTPAGQSYLVSTTVRNSGASATQLTGFFDVQLGSGNSGRYEDRTRTYLIGPGATETLSISVPYKSGRSCTGGTLDLEIWDSQIKLWETPNNQPFALSGGSATTPVAHDLWMNPVVAWSPSTSSITLEFGGDLPAKNNDSPVTLSLTVTKDGSPLAGFPKDVTVTKSVRTAVIPQTSLLGEGNYVASLTYPGGFTVSDPILVRNTAPPAFTPTSGSNSFQPQPSVSVEVGFLDALVQKFCPYYYNSATASPMTNPAPDPHAERCNFARNGNSQLGDVFPDTRDVLNNDLPTRLIDPTKTGYTKQCNGNVQGAPRYDWTRVLVVGSNVDHNSMTSGAAKYSVCEWVMGGGTLIVFGSVDQQVNWLQPIFHAAIASSSSALNTPDASHPILNRADPLGYDSYDTRNQVWSFNGQTAAEQEQLLTNVVAAGSDSALTISNPGAFGNGTVILTTWLPYDLFDSGPGTSNAEGLKVVNNFLMQGYRDLFLDYGPEIPSAYRQSAAAQRAVEIRHPEFTEPIVLTLFVYVF